MKPSEIPTGGSQRRELVGPRPPPLTISRFESQKTSKQHLVQPQPRQPVIIHTVSPKPIHVDASEFKDLVQRLTGLQPQEGGISSEEEKMKGKKRKAEIEQGSLEMAGKFPGIISSARENFPVPADPSPSSLFQDLSPLLHGNRNLMERSFLPSPSGSLSALLSSPAQNNPSLDLFNNFSDHFQHFPPP